MVHNQELPPGESAKYEEASYMGVGSDRQTRKIVRISVGLESEQHELLRRVSAEKRVSIAWVMREAVRRYLAQVEPLLPLMFDERTDR